MAIHRCSLFLTLLGLACSKTSAQTAQIPHSSAAFPAGARAPQVDLGPHLTPLAAVEEGRFATVVQRRLQGTHSLHVMREDSAASFGLELQPDGTASACRGWRYFFSNDGPQVHTEERFQEQQGYRGRHVSRAGFVEIELALDDSACPTRSEHAASTPERASTLRLRCVLAQPTRHALLASPVFLCQPYPGEDFASELRPHVVPEVAERWFALGTEHGLRIELTGRPASARAGDPLRVIIERASAAATRQRRLAVIQGFSPFRELRYPPVREAVRLESLLDVASALLLDVVQASRQC